MILLRSPHAGDGEIYAGTLLLELALTSPDAVERLLKKMPDDIQKQMFFRDLAMATAALEKDLHW